MLRHFRRELSTADLIRARDSVAAVGRLSDGLMRLGPLRLGVDGVLSWVPVIGELYSAGAAAVILVQGLRARVPAHILVVCAALMASRTAITAAPLAGPLAADLFTAHRWSARLVVRAIEARLPVSERTGGARPRRRWRAAFA
jgi:hypothetical protein